jgi:hypothetical protein
VPQSKHKNRKEPIEKLCFPSFLYRPAAMEIKNRLEQPARDFPGKKYLFIIHF